MRALLLASLLSALYLSSFSQNNTKKMTIKGTVFDDSGKALNNAVVMVDGKETHELTSQSGRFRIRVPVTAHNISIFSFGNGIISEYIGGRNEINFRFNAKANAPVHKAEPEDEMINMGYSSVKRKDITTQVSRVDGRKKNYSSYSSIFEMIQRECSGVRVTNGSVTIGSVQPLFVVDGTYVNSISDIPPSSVESIEVLKGTSASIYGSRGTRGAIVITTKLKTY